VNKIFLGLCLGLTALGQADYKNFIFVIPSYNNERWVEQNLKSVLDQDYPVEHFGVIYINDCSTDNTAARVAEVVANHPKGKVVSIINNATRQGAMRNFFEVVNQRCLPSEIVVNLDGDDWLADNDVLSYLNSIYGDSGVWVTYGRYKYYPYDCPFTPGTAPYPAHIVQNGLFRKDAFRASHLRTYYAWLFQKIAPKDLKNSKGEFFSMCPDLAIMYPILEMASEHHCCVDKTLCVYNIANPLNENKVDVDKLMDITREIQAKPQYKRLTEPLSRYINGGN
jgi:glycosyltransferase involved in cell wall biosynthesis